MAKKKAAKSETRKHTGMLRVDAEALSIARKAASLMEVSLADYVSDMIKKHAHLDIEREARKLAKGGKDS